MLSTKYLGITCRLRDKQIQKLIKDKLILSFLRDESYQMCSDCDMHGLADGSEIRTSDSIVFTQIFNYCLVLYNFLLMKELKYQS